MLFIVALPLIFCIIIFSIYVCIKINRKLGLTGIYWSGISCIKWTIIVLFGIFIIESLFLLIILMIPTINNKMGNLNNLKEENMLIKK